MAISIREAEREAESPDLFEAPERRAHYTPVGIAFHWTMAALIGLQLYLGWRTTWVAAGYDKVEAYSLHASFGLLILMLATLRLAWRMFVPRPHNTEDMHGWQHWASRIVHWLLYGAMFALPLSGWLILSATAREMPIRLFGVIDWPHMPFFETMRILERARFEDLGENLHAFLVWSLLALLAMHVGAALKHYFIDKDDVLARMIPWLARGRSASRTVDPTGGARAAR